MDKEECIKCVELIAHGYLRMAKERVSVIPLDVRESIDAILKYLEENLK